MPITEIVRIIARSEGVLPDGGVVTVSLAVDTDGRFGLDRNAIGRPMFWLKTPRETLGPYEHEDQAIEAARRAYRAVFK